VPTESQLSARSSQTVPNALADQIAEYQEAAHDYVQDGWLIIKNPARNPLQSDGQTESDQS